MLNIFYQNLYIRFQVNPLIDIVIIQIISNTPRANWKMLKNEKCTCSSKDYICRIFYHTNHLLNVSLKRKNRKHFHSYNSCDYRRESKTHFYATKRCWLTTRKPFSKKMFANPRFLLANVAVHDETNWNHHLQVAKHFGCMYAMIEGLCGCATLVIRIVLTDHRLSLRELSVLIKFSQKISVFTLLIVSSPKHHIFWMCIRIASVITHPQHMILWRNIEIFQFLSF